MVVAGCGGEVFYDPYPSVRYRQHDGNLVGTKSGWGALLQRARMLMVGRFRMWNEKNIEALQHLQCHLTPESRATLLVFATARGRWLLPRLVGLNRAGIYRQTFLGNLGLLIAGIVNKI
jgi:hypothetical protein